MIVSRQANARPPATSVVMDDTEVMNNVPMTIALAVWGLCAQAQPGEAEKRVTAANEAVDSFIGTLVPQRVQAKAVEKTLKNILAAELHEGDPPSVYVTAHPQHGPFLVAVYTLDRGFMGSGGTAVTLRVYHVRGGRFRLANIAGKNMDGYGRVTVKELHSPKQGEVWLLLWGYMTGANGPNVRMRVVACDGKQFRDVWMPENSWGAFKVNVTANGFTVEGEYYREGGLRRDAYFIAEDGLYKQHR